MKIASLFKLNNCEEVSFTSNSSTETTSSYNLGAIIPAFLKNDQNDEDSELVIENQDLVQNVSIDSDEIIDQHIPAHSITTSNTNIFKNNSNATKLTTFSNKISRESNTRTLDGYVDRLINTQEQVPT